TVCRFSRAMRARSSWFQPRSSTRRLIFSARSAWADVVSSISNDPTPPPRQRTGPLRREAARLPAFLLGRATGNRRRTEATWTGAWRLDLIVRLERIANVVKSERGSRILDRGRAGRAGQCAVGHLAPVLPAARRRPQPGHPAAPHRLV